MIIIKFREFLARLEDHQHWIDRVAYANGLLSGIALYPQLIKLFITHDAQGLSLVTFAIIFTSSATWIVYALHRRTLGLLISSLMNSGAAAAILVLLVSLPPPT